MPLEIAHLVAEQRERDAATHLERLRGQGSTSKMDDAADNEEMERLEGIFSAWGRILTGYTPALSIELTRECPLRCPGCYAYGDDHLGGDVTLREVRDFKGQELVDGVLALVDRHRPLQVSIVGGEPLVRYREL